MIDLETIGRLAVCEHAAWKSRNKARSDLREFFHQYQDETGEEFFSRDEALPEEKVKFDALNGEAKKAQRRLTTARAATRRAIVRAAAEIGKAMP